MKLQLISQMNGRAKLGAIKLLAMPFFSAAISISAQKVSPAARVSSQVIGEVVHTINDPQTGHRWLLLRGPKGGPGRLVPAPADSKGHLLNDHALQGYPTSDPSVSPVICAGDRVIVEENSPVVSARLEAIALGPALSGSQLNVRLAIGGHVVRALALGPGRAVFASNNGARP